MLDKNMGLGAVLRLDQTTDLAAGIVIADHRNEGRRRSQRPQIAKHVPGAPEALHFALDPQHRDWRFGRHALDLAEYVMIEHDVADAQHPRRSQVVYIREEIAIVRHRQFLVAVPPRVLTTLRNARKQNAVAFSSMSQKTRPFIWFRFTGAGAGGRRQRRGLRAAARIRRRSSRSSSHPGTDLLRIPGPLDPNPRPVMTSTQRRPASWEAAIKAASARCASACVIPCRSRVASISRRPRLSRSALARSIPAKRSSGAAGGDGMALGFSN